MSHCVDNFTVVMSPHRNLLESIKSRILEQTGDKNPVTKNWIWDALFFPDFIHSCQVLLWACVWIMFWCGPQEVVYCVSPLLDVSVYWITQGAARPGGTRYSAADPWAKTVESQEEEYKQSGGCGHTHQARPHMISHEAQLPGSPQWQHNGPLRANRAQSQLAFSQIVLRENLLVMRLICTILFLAQGSNFLFSHKEIVPGIVHQSNVMVIIKEKIRLLHGFMLSRFTQVS